MHHESLKHVFKHGWITQLPESVAEALLKISKVRSLAKGQRLHAKNDLPDGLYCVVEGKIRVSNVNTQGKEMVLTWLDAGSWFGEISLFDGLPRTHDAHAESDSKLLLIPNAAFQMLLHQQPQLYPVFVRLLCQRLRLTFSIIDESGGLSLQGQLAKRLLLLADGWNPPVSVANSRTIQISQESLAHMLNSSRQTVNKLLNELKSAGLVQLEYGTITIIDHTGLQHLCML